MLRVPLEAVRREEWLRNSKRSDRALNESSTVHEQHFEAGFIQVTFHTIINGIMSVRSAETDRS